MTSLGVCQILVVDDNRDARDSLVLVLELVGHRAVAVESGAAAIRAMRAAANSDTPFNLAIVDVGMPEMSGYELVRAIREEAVGDSIYVVALTGWVSPSDRARALASGFDAHLPKPIGLPEIRALLQRVGTSEDATH